MYMKTPGIYHSSYWWVCENFRFMKESLFWVWSSLNESVYSVYKTTIGLRFLKTSEADFISYCLHQWSLCLKCCLETKLWTILLWIRPIRFMCSAHTSIYLYILNCLLSYTCTIVNLYIVIPLLVFLLFFLLSVFFVLSLSFCCTAVASWKQIPRMCKQTWQ